MTRPEPMSYEAIFARSAPPPRPAPVRRGKYDFAIAYPDPGSLPVDDLADGLRSALEEEGRGLAVYPDIQGYPPLREFIAGKLARDRGMSVSPDQIVLGNGSSEPIDMLIQAVVDPGDVVLTEDYVYSGTLGRLRRYHAEIRGVACDENGMVPDTLEATLRTAIADGKKPKLIYTIPTFQNPQGWTAPLDRREALLNLSQEYGVPILEDDCYVDLRYDGEPVPAIHSLDDASHVMYVASFSKTIAPGLRTGYLVAPPEVVGRVRAIKGGAGANQFAAMAIHRYAIDHLDEHVSQIIGVQRARRDAMLAALGEGLRNGRDMEQSGRRPLHLAQDGRGVRSHRSPGRVSGRRGRLSGGERLLAGRRLGQELRPALLRVQRPRGDPRGNLPARRRLREERDADGMSGEALDSPTPTAG